MLHAVRRCRRRASAPAPLGWYSNLKMLIKFYAFKERVHSDIKTCKRLDYCLCIQPITLIFLKRDPTLPSRLSVFKICTSGDQHRTIHGPSSHHPQTCIRISVDLHQNIRGPASEHPRTCLIMSEDLHQNAKCKAEE